MRYAYLGLRMRTLKVTIEYDGTNYLGWQIQPQGLTIQGILEEKLALLTGQKTQVTASGRTDAGVHALNQVAHFRTESQMEVPSFQKALNSVLPPDIVIKRIEEVEEGFHARKHAKSKVYVYQILNRSLRSPFHRTTTWHVPQKLDLREMKRATQHLLGEHDFSAFRSVGSPTRTAVRKVLHAEWRMGRDGFLRFEIEATGFLKQMVRAIVGTLVEVGRGKISAQELKTILDSKDRKQAGPTAPAHGLFLKEVRYDNPQGNWDKDS
jgi:tRNA pseudouridine38-40 synthase